MEFVNGKPKGTNPAITGNICAVNGSKRQSILLQENHIKIMRTMHNAKSKTKNKTTNKLHVHVA